MKIGIVLISDGWAGAENAVYNLLKNCQNANFYLFLNEEIFHYYEGVSKNIINIGILYHPNKLVQYIRYLKIRNRLKQSTKLNNIKMLILFLGDSFIISSCIRKITVPSLRGTEIIEHCSPSKNLRSSVLKIIFKRIFDKSPKIISLSKWQIQNLPEKYKKKTVVIPNGVDSKIFKPLKNIEQKKNVILFTGRFIDIKGIREIINVAKQLPQYEFWFAGQGPLANLINLSNTKNLGFKNQNELIRLYNQATICILPSYREGFSNVGLEVTACGRALICTPLGFSEYIENEKDGIIIPARDEKALKEAIVKLMTNKTLRKKIEKNARKKALEYSWNEIAKQYVKVFKEVIKNEKNI